MGQAGVSMVKGGDLVQTSGELDRVGDTNAICAQMHMGFVYACACACVCACACTVGVLSGRIEFAAPSWDGPRAFRSASPSGELMPLTQTPCNRTTPDRSARGGPCWSVGNHSTSQSTCTLG